jgi:predicted GIY-YIG superfamily endonuclease
MYANALDMDVALSDARSNCFGISDELTSLKKMAGISTAITGVGTLAGGGAIYTGFAKQRKDKLAEELEGKLAEIESMTDDQLLVFLAEVAEYKNTQNIENELEKTTAESKNLGNWRTGLMGGATATNVAGAIIAGNNKVKGDLKSQIDSCKSAVENLRDASMQARMDGKDITAAQSIIDNCKGWDTFDISKINNRAAGAMWSSVAGATTGTAGTITSAIANTDKTRNNNTDSGKSKEKNLNTASNILAIGTTVASGTATVFNATQIAAIKKASDIADGCERAVE